MKKMLVVVTNIAKYQGVDIDRATGLWLGEAVHFVHAVEEKGYQVDFVSPKGGYTPIDPHSLTADMMTPLDWKYYQNQSFMNRLGNTLSVDVIDASDYDVIYYTGGHGVIWDFPENEALQQIAMDIYHQGGIISSVCHGAAGILNLKEGDGSYFIADKMVTGFSNSEEKEVQLDRLVPYLTEDELVKRGAHYEQAGNWLPFAIADGRLVTGQNPASGAVVAEKVMAILENK
ncbi:type 1 glutamine amidotransferase domain-containing protein [Catellicoccus marimammalium]|uniref:ThiJ/PfpI family protein n=1 Tax=Catellicoccus marimammalium M35/04/3 TaxID=1234409 RepID=K8ZNG5_9ENTE|nr:type 1 glutamine amidotransferase domain-containing protein [Catellicoccus marimammalium]EKU27126.1 ThiJ/PfpI family protein [Catellicoccus marimammalium M35/04/3]